MTTEPHDITTVSIRALPPNPPECRTREQTIAAIRARFPHCFTESGLAIPSRLADMENARRLRAMGQEAKTYTYGGKTTRTPEAEAQRIANLQDALAAKSEATRQRILSALAEPKTAADLSVMLKISDHGIRKHLNELMERGEVVRFFLQRCAVWRLAERKVEAAE